MNGKLVKVRRSRNERPKVKTVLWMIVLLIFVAGVTFLVFFFFKIRESKPEEITNNVSQETPEPGPVYHGKEPNCPNKYCISATMNGDLLFHPELWNHFIDAEKGYDFTALFVAQSQYYAKTDIAICDFETPIAALGGPYLGYPIFSIPPQVADAAAAVGYKACTTDTNHSFDNGTEGINRLIDKLDEVGVAHTGTYKTETESSEPLVMETEGGKVALIGGTVSLNGFTADYDWQVDRMRDGDMRQYDIDRATAKAQKAREQGADIVILQLHSLQEYITYADGWQQSIAHEMADTGLFDLIYFHGSHSVQPAENYNGIYIFYGLGNSVTVSAGEASRAVNDEGLTVRAQFTSEDGEKWQINKLSYLPTYNKTGANFAWCPLTVDHPSGFCVSEAEDIQMFNRMHGILYSMGISETDKVLVPWLITTE